MTMETFASVFDTAGDDVESEARERIHTMATQQATSTCWPFLVLAKSEPEFEHRLALIEDRLTSIASEHGVSSEEITAPLREGFKAVLAASKEAGLDPKASSGLKCADCGHSNVPHAEGGPCACGCVAFNPMGKRSSLNKQAIKCGTCGEEIVFDDPGEPTYSHMKVNDKTRDHEAHPGGPKESSLEVQAGRDEWEHDCTECGATTTSTRESQDCKCGNKAENLYTTYKGKTASLTTQAKPWEWRMSPGDPLGRGQYHLAEWSDECKPGGSGICDGFKDNGFGSGGECGCSCHNAFDLPQTVEGVKAWHDDLHGVGKESSRKTAADEDTGVRFQCPTCHGIGMSFSMKSPAEGGGLKHCDTCADSGIVYRKRKGDSAGGYSYKDFDFSPAPRTASRDSFEDRLASIKQALSDGVDPLSWLAGDSPVAAPSHHDTTQQFLGDNPVALDQAMAEGGGTGQAENEVGHQSKQATQTRTVYTGLSKKVHILQAEGATYCGSEQAPKYRMTISPTANPATCPKCIRLAENDGHQSTQASLQEPDPFA